MTIQDVNARLWKQLAQKFPAVVEDLKSAVKGMTEDERFTFMRLSIEVNVKDPIAFLKRMRARPEWERHCDLKLRPQSGHLAGYIAFFSEKKSA